MKRKKQQSIKLKTVETVFFFRLFQYCHRPVQWCVCVCIRFLRGGVRSLFTRNTDLLFYIFIRFLTISLISFEKSVQKIFFSPFLAENSIDYFLGIRYFLQRCSFRVYVSRARVFDALTIKLKSFINNS